MSESRIEMLLEALLNGEKPTIKPQSRVEAYLCALCEKGLGGANMFEPVTQEEYDALVAAGTVDASKYYLIVGDSV